MKLGQTMTTCACAWLAAAVTAADVERPIYPAKGEAGTYIERVEPLMAMSEADMLALVPETNGQYYVGCPNCDGGTQDRQMDWNGIDDPHRVHCRYCNMTFPNDQYPMDQSVTVTNRAGRQETWRYYERDGDQYYFAAAARYFAKHFVADRTHDLAQAYALSGDEKYARRAVLLLARFAEVYPQWCVVASYPAPGKKYPVDKAEPPYPYWGGLWHFWHLYDTPKPLVFALDLVWNSRAMQDVSDELGYDVRQRVADNVVRPNVAFQRAYTAEMAPYNGIAPQRSAGFILMGRVIGEPDFVHDGVARIELYVKSNFFGDGMDCRGTIAYHRTAVTHVKIAADFARGYSDPPGYIAPRDKTRYDDLDLLARVPSLGRAHAAEKWFVFPNGHHVCTHDAWATTRDRPTAYADRPMLFPHFGHGRLTSGTGADAMQAHLHYSIDHYHTHFDDLNIILFAHGRELLPDIGYTHTRWRFWPTSTAAHNTVVVNHQDQPHVPSRGGDLQLYDTTDPIVTVIDVSQPQAYPRVVDTYRRRLMLVRMDDERSYVVDVFRVRGGKQHDYVLHGSADLPQTAQLSVPLSPVEGPLLGEGATYRLPERESDKGEFPEGFAPGYAMFRDLQMADISGPLDATWRFDDDDIAAGLRSHLLHPASGRIVLGQTPQIRPVRTDPKKEDNSKLDQYWRPSLVVRREGAAALTSVFVAVHEPFSGKPFIADLSATVEGDGVEAPVTLTVRHAKGIDRIETRPDGDVVLFERKADGNVVHRYALTDKRYAGAVRATSDLTLTVAGDVPTGDALHGRTVVVTFGDGRTLGLRIDSVERDADMRLLRLRDDPGFVVTDRGAKLTCFPLHDIEGPVTYHIATD